MWFGPIFWLELSRASRRRRLWRIRVGYAGILLFAMWLGYPDFISGESPQVINAGSQFARGFFIAYNWLQLIAVCFLTPAFLAGAIAEDRERKIFDYLLASPLTNQEIILGKILPRVLDIAGILLTALPLLGIVQLMGGITSTHWWYALGLAGNLVILAAALSIWVSARHYRVRTCLIQVYLLLAVFFIGPWVISPLAASWPKYSWIPDYLEWNPPFVLNYISTCLLTGTRLSYDHLLQMTAVHVGLSALLIAHAVWRLRAISQPLQSKANRRRARGWQLFRPPLGEHAMYWKELFARSGFDWGWTGRIAGGLLLLTLCGTYLYWFVEITNHRRVEEREILGVTLCITIGLACLINLIVTIHAATSVTGEREGDTWLSLLSTPISPGTLIRAKIAGSLYAGRFLYALIGLLWLIALSCVPGLIVAYVPFVFCLLIIVGFFAVFGVYCSCYYSTSWRALTAACLTYLFLHGAYLFCCFPIAMWLRSDEEVFFAMSFCAPFVLFAVSFPIFLITHGSYAPDIWYPLLAGVIGVMIYLIAGLGFYQVTIEQFDKFMGRVRPRYGPPPNRIRQ